MDQASTRWAAFLEEAPFLTETAPLSPRDPVEVIHGMPRSLRDLVTTDVALERRGYRSAPPPQDASVIVSLVPTPGGLREMGASFHWGYARALFALGPLQATRASIAPDVTESQWATTFEHFEEARDDFGRGAYHDALQQLEGLGEVEEWRVHFLHGLLRLGFAGGLSAVVDLKAAESSFRLAARFSQAREPSIAAQALAGAAFAALRLDGAARASGYADAGARLGEPLPELLFLGAEARLRRDDPEGCIALLERALILDPTYAFRMGPLAGAIGDAQAWTEQVTALRSRLWERLSVDVSTMLESAPGITEIEGNDPPAVAGRRLGAFVTHGASLRIYDMLQTYNHRDELLTRALEGASGQRSVRSVYVDGPEVARVETKVTEREVREKVVKREAGLFRKEDAEWVTTKKTSTQTVNVKRASRVRRVAVVDGAGQVVADHELIRIPRGTFTMGSAPDSAMRSDDELRHEVTLSRPFYAGRTPVAQLFFEAVHGANPSFFHGEQLPVEQVSFFDALRFCNELSAMESLPPAYDIGDTSATWINRPGGGYRLLTEAEWEYMCRAGTQSAFWCGDELTLAHGTYGRRQGARTTPWGQFPPNHWGLYDVHGNVWEWVFDGYDRYATGAVMDPVNDRDTEARIARGGSWASEMSECRSATRTSFSPWHHHNNVGFRLAIDAMDEDP